ncbi:hypothetical protein PSENEW3_00000418 [Picochlorum sp. SENEW3]|nr:hypothetical protein PSENEW3_00000418 [Picochlorum sp. SENEW3]
MDARQGRGNGYAPESWKTLCELERTLSVKLVSAEDQKGTLLSSGENASTLGADEARGGTGVDSRFDVFLDAAQELDRRGKSTAGEGGNLISTQEDGMTEKERTLASGWILHRSFTGPFGVARQTGRRTGDVTFRHPWTSEGSVPPRSHYRPY